MSVLKKSFYFVFICFQGVFFALSAAAAAQPTGKLIIFHAGSLTVPMASIERAFEARYPHVDVLREAAGSQKCAREISELKKPCDIMASADYKVIDKLLIPEFATWNIRFASNRMVLCYTDTSAYAGEISPTNCYEIIDRPDASWGHADPCGYRSLMVLQLADDYYRKPGLESFAEKSSSGKHPA